MPVFCIKRVSAEEFAAYFPNLGLPLQSFKEAKCQGEFVGFNLRLYKTLEQHQMSLIMAAFADDTPVGWCGGYTSNDTYCGGFLMAQESIYIVPEYRNGMLPGRLMRAFEQEAERFPDCRGVLWTVHPGSPLERTLERHYRLYSKNYIKEF